MLLEIEINNNCNIWSVQPPSRGICHVKLLKGSDQPWALEIEGHRLEAMWGMCL